MPLMEKKGQTLTIDFSDLDFSRFIPWKLLGVNESQVVELERLREDLFEFLDTLETLRLAQQRRMCMNLVDGRVCHAKALYVVDRAVYLCESCWENYADDDSALLEDKVEF